MLAPSALLIPRKSTPSRIISEKHRSYHTGAYIITTSDEMHSLRTPSFFRPMGRPTSPAPSGSRTDTLVVTERHSRPLSKLSFSNFKRTSSPLPQSTPALVHNGSYMEVLSLKLSEAVSKALAQPVGPGHPGEMLGGKRAIPAGRGREMGEFIATYVCS